MATCIYPLSPPPLPLPFRPELISKLHRGKVESRNLSSRKSAFSPCPACTSRPICIFRERWPLRPRPSSISAVTPAFSKTASRMETRQIISIMPPGSPNMATWHLSSTLSISGKLRANIMERSAGGGGGGPRAATHLRAWRRGMPFARSITWRRVRKSICSASASRGAAAVAPTPGFLRRSMIAPPRWCRSPASRI